jgi:methylglutaconyl-CoA hydratase
MATTSTLLIDRGTVTTLTLNRPDKHNAFDDALIDTLTTTLNTIANDKTVHSVVLRAAGDTFCAGADLNWMRDMVNYSQEENYADAQRLAALLHRLYTLPQPTVAVVQGAALGGGVGLVACCDIAIAAEDARFCFTETRLGLIPASIAPYVIQAMGPRHAKRLFMTAEPFSSAEALRLGLVHQLAKSDKLSVAAKAVCQTLAKNSPDAIQQAKVLTHLCAPFNKALLDETSRWIADSRVSKAGQEGLQAFLEKRSPNWRN